MLEAKSRIELNPEVIHRNLSEGSVLLHGRSGQYHGLNELGTLIWEYLERSGPVDLSDLLEAVAGAVVDAPPDVETDVCDFVQALSERDLVVIG